MPFIESLSLKNFKGVGEVTVDLVDRAKCPVITLIGLNESGKTTILEGLSHFTTGDKSVSGIFEGIYPKASGTGLVPIHKKAAFSSDIEISGIVRLDEADIQKIRSLANKHRLILDELPLREPIDVTTVLEFEDSELIETNDWWTFDLMVKKKGVGEEIPFKEYERPRISERDLWEKVVNQIKDDLPQVMYFPTFLVEMPERIYLQEHERETALNKHYRQVLQDILNSLGEDLSLEKHVCSRITSFKATTLSANWFSTYLGTSGKVLIDSVFQKISSTVTREVLGSWQRIFQRPISAKTISVDWSIDHKNDDLPYASFYISDGESRYALSERSLGFRWFFSFLLFTAFKKAKQRPTIFIFDEPAANLHAKAQAELMKSFAKIASDGNRIIYSTHSHHMINPQWLSGAYIVENTALDYEGGDSFELSAKPTNIRLIKYRDFVSQYPTRSSYFQPVIEKLEYATPEVIGIEPFVIVEGISDYYALRLAAIITKAQLPFRLMPGAGAGSLGPLISLLLGRGERFYILLDDDKAGNRAAERYKDEWYLDEKAVFTLAAVGKKFAGKQLEGVITTDTLQIIMDRLGMTVHPTKKQIGWYLAEKCAALGDETCISPDCIDNLMAVLNHLRKHVLQTGERDLNNIGMMVAA